MKQLIIGCGYLGKRVAHLWLARGDHVTALTRSADNADALRATTIEPIIGDVLDPASLRALPKVDTLLYAVGFDRSSGRSQRDIYVNGLRNVLEAVASRVGRVIYISSTSVYGQSNGEWIDESSATKPTQPGGHVCLEAEHTLRKQLANQKSSPVATVLRLAGIYGPGRLLRRINALKTGEPLTGNGDAWLNLIHVDDAARAVLACEEFGETGQTYLICDDRPIRRSAYFEKLASLVDAPVPVFEEQPGGSADAAKLNKRCSNRKLHDVLQMSLQYADIDAGLPHAVGNTA